MAFNVGNIINSELITRPWEYKVVDDAINSEVWDKLVLMPKMLLKKDRRNDIPLMGDLLQDSKVDNHGAIIDIPRLLKVGMPNGIIEHLYDCGQSLLDAREEILSGFSEHRESSDNQYYVDISLDFLHPGTRYQPFQGTLNKSLTCITFLSPDIQDGIYLHKNDNMDYSREIEWKRNRSLIFAPKDDTNWISFHNPEHLKSIRFVITMSIEFVAHTETTFNSGKKYISLAKHR